MILNFKYNDTLYTHFQFFCGYKHVCSMQIRLLRLIFSFKIQKYPRNSYQRKFDATEILSTRFGVIELQVFY